MSSVELTDFSNKKKRNHDLERGTTREYNEKLSNRSNGRLMAILIVELFITSIIYLKYYDLTQLHILLASALLGSACGALGQSCNQYFKQYFNFSKVLKFMFWGFVNGILTQLWVEYLCSHFDNKLVRVILDQLVGAPIFQAIFNLLGILWDQGKSLQNIRSSYIKSMKYSYCFWPVISVVQFLVISDEFIFPINCIGNIAWNILLSKLG